MFAAHSFDQAAIFASGWLPWTSGASLWPRAAEIRRSRCRLLVLERPCTGIPEGHKPTVQVRGNVETCALAATSGRGDMPAMHPGGLKTNGARARTW